MDGGQIKFTRRLLCQIVRSCRAAGNFKTLEEAIREYSADAMRIALADAGDAMDDANFEHSTANGAILRLTKVKKPLPELIIPKP